MEQTSIKYREFPPSESLRPYLINFWEFTVEQVQPAGYEHHVPPDGCVSIVLHYGADGREPNVLFIGPRIETHRVPIQEPSRYLGVRLWPHSIRAVLGADPATLFGTVGPAQFFVPSLVETLAPPKAYDQDDCVRRFEQVILGRVESSLLDTLVGTAVERIVAAQGNLTVAGLAKELGISPRSLQRRFRDQTGLSPKQFARLRRFRAAALELTRETSTSWAEVAYDVGFSDQAHLSREFSQIIGLTAEQLRQKHAVIEHDGVDPDADDEHESSYSS